MKNEQWNEKCNNFFFQSNVVALLGHAVSVSGVFKFKTHKKDNLKAQEAHEA